MGACGPEGLALRIEPDGTRMTVLAHNFRNAYELAVDSFGDLWQNDNDDQVMTCRTTWLMEGANAGYFSADGTRFWQADRRPGQDYVHGALAPGRSRRPAGRRQHRRRALRLASSATRATCSASRYRGLLLSADAGRNVIFGYHAEGARRRVRARAFRFPVEPRRAERELHLESGRSGSTQVVSAERRRGRRRTARSTWPTGTIRSSAGTRCRTARATAASTASRRKAANAHDAVDRFEHDRRSDPGAAQSGGQRAQQRLRSGSKPRAPRRCTAVKRVLADPNPYHRARAIVAAGAARSGRRPRSRAPARRRATRRSASPRSARCVR